MAFTVTDTVLTVVDTAFTLADFVMLTKEAS
jgi:hypothetical protein